MTTSNLTGSGAAQGGANIVGSGVGDGPGPDVMAASTLDSTTVITSDGEDVGKIKDIMLDVRSGRVAYAVLSSGGFLGMGDTLRAIPWNALTLDTDQKVFRVDITADRIKSEPGFDKDHWPAMLTLAGEPLCISTTIASRIGRPPPTRLPEALTR